MMRRLFFPLSPTTPFIFALSLLLSSCGESDPKAPGFVMADGKGVRITRADLDAYVARHLNQRGMKRDQISPAKLAQLEQELTKQCVVEALLLNEAKGLDSKAIASRVDAQMADIRSHYPIDESFQARLLQLKMTKEEMQNELTRKVTIEELLKTKIQMADIPPSTVETYYKDHPTEFTQPATVRASHVLIRVPKDANATVKASKKKTIDAARARVMNKEDFGKVAQEISDDKESAARGGDLGFLTKGKIAPAFERWAFQTKIGEVSSVFESPYGYHFLKVTDSKPTNMLTSDQAKEIIVKKLTNLQHQKSKNKYTMRLLKEAAITYHLVTSSESSHK